MVRHQSATDRDANDWHTREAANLAGVTGALRAGGEDRRDRGAVVLPVPDTATADQSSLSTACIAHELVQPLCAIVRCVEQCQRLVNSDGPEASELRMMLDRLSTQASHAVSLVQQVRAAIRNEYSPAEACDLNGLLREAVRQAHGRADAERVAIDLDTTTRPLIAKGNRVELGQVFDNLIGNALESLSSYPASGGQVRIRARSFGAVAEIRIEDNGPGFKDSEPESCFAPFHTTKPTGLGVGLTLCRRIVERAGGQIWAEPSRLGGAALVVALPIER